MLAVTAQAIQRRVLGFVLERPEICFVLVAGFNNLTRGRGP